MPSDGGPFNSVKKIIYSVLGPERKDNMQYGFATLTEHGMILKGFPQFPPEKCGGDSISLTPLVTLAAYYLCLSLHESSTDKHFLITQSKVCCPKNPP